MATRGKRTMLIRSLGLEQFDHGVSVKPTSPPPKWFERSYETNEGTQNETQTTPKWN
jgi:hypothetical protein